MNSTERDLEWKIDKVDHAGQESFRIRNGVITYVYHMEGCGFASLLDRDGNDWLSFGPADGAFGLARGIPNMARDIFGQKCPEPCSECPAPVRRHRRRDQN